jgi:hypothetical protein
MVMKSFGVALTLLISVSAIYYLLRRISTPRARTKQFDLGQPSWKERRQSQRRVLHGTVGVYGHGLANQPFHDEAVIRDVSDNGGLLHLGVPVHNGQQLIVINDAASQKVRVVRVHMGDDRRFDVAVEFQNPSSEFWRRTEPVPEISNQVIHA